MVTFLRLKALLFAVLIPLLTIVGPARAQSNGSGQGAQAESLFQEGRALLDSGETERACSALEESLRLERAVGTLLNLARCYEQMGLVASAWTTFAEAEAEALRLGQKERLRLAQSQKNRLSQFVPRVIIRVHDAGPTTRLELDGREMGVGALGVPLALDPGEHEIVVKDGMKKPLQHRFRIAHLSAESDEQPPLPITLGPLEAPSDPQPGSQEEADLAGTREGDRGISAKMEDSSTDRGNAQAIRSANSSSLSDRRPSQKNGLLVGGIVAIAVGTVAGGVGLVLGISALSKASSADCDASNECSRQGVDQRKEARNQLRVGYAVGLSGTAILGAGLLLFTLSRHSPKKSRVSLAAPGADLGGVSLDLAF